MPRFVGVDPGLRGAICWFGPGAMAMVGIEPMPTAGGKLDVGALVGLFRQTAYPEWVVYIERPQPLPPKMGGVQANFARGYQLG